MSGRIVHFELPFDDGGRAKEFYSGVFGWDLQSMPGMDYLMVATGPTGDQGPSESGFINGGMGPRTGRFAAPTVVVDVQDIDATLAQVESAGGSVVEPKGPVGDMGWTAYFADSEGNVVGLWQTAPQG